MYEILNFWIEVLEVTQSFQVWMGIITCYAGIPPLWTAELYYFIVTLTRITIAFIKNFWELT